MKIASDLSRKVYDAYHEMPWFVAVGVGTHHEVGYCILYVKKTARLLAKDFKATEGLGIPIVVRRSGAFKAT